MPRSAPRSTTLRPRSSRPQPGRPRCSAPRKPREWRSWRRWSAGDEAYFLCHGADGGRQAGFALCVSDGVSLPPSALAIDAVPELKRFTLDWLDLEALQAAPWLLVSMACSTGRTVVDSGGSRLGMEQALLARGTSAIVSPQWDIDQVAALSWLGAFGARAAEDDPSIAARVSRATIATREQFGHWYFWGPFTLTGSLFKFVTQPK